MSSVATSPVAAELLLQELDRARTAKDGKLPGMSSTWARMCLFVDEATQTPHGVQLVYPASADISLGRVSVLTLSAQADGHAPGGDRLAGLARPLPALRILDVAQPA